MKIGFLSDTHGYHQYLKVEECDILIHCGDYTMTGAVVSEATKFMKWFAQTPARYKVFINGNHEVDIANMGYTRALAKDFGLIYLENELKTIENISIFGSPNTPEFGKWAYMYPRDRAIKQWENTPKCDILVTHGPPHGILDQIGKENVGCPGLLSALNHINPKIHAFGHIHEGRGELDYQGTKFINCSIMNEVYMPTGGISYQNWL